MGTGTRQHIHNIMHEHYYNIMCYVGHLMLQAGSLVMCEFATGGMQMEMVGSVEVEQVNCCVVLLAPTLQSIEMTPTIEVADVECRGSSLFLSMHPSGFVTFSFATCGIQMATAVSVVVVWEGNFVLVPTTGPPTTEMTQTIEEVAVGCLGNCVFSCNYDYTLYTCTIVFIYYIH